MIEKNIDTKVLQNYSGDFSAAVISKLGDEVNVIGGKDILNLTPSKQVNFFILKILYTKWQDEMKRLESPYFNYKNEEVRKALNTFMNVLSQHIEVRKEDIEPILSQAVELTIKWLIYPSAELKEEVSQRDIKTVEGIKNLVRYYKIYHEDLKYLTGQKEGVEISQFLEEWDQLMEQKSVASTIDKELGLLNQVVPISINDLVGEEEADQPEVEEPKEGIEDSDSNELAEEAVEQDASVEEDDDEVKKIDGLEASMDEDDSMETEAMYNQEVEEDPEDSDELIQEEQEDEESEPDDSVNKQFAKSEETLHDKYKEEQVSVAAKHQQKKISSILEAVSVNQEYMFTTELFGGEKVKFLEAVEKIENCSSFDESVEMLVSDYSPEYSWNMNSPEVKELLKVVFRRFR